MQRQTLLVAAALTAAAATALWLWPIRAPAPPPSRGVSPATTRAMAAAAPDAMPVPPPSAAPPPAEVSRPPSASAPEPAPAPTPEPAPAKPAPSVPAAPKRATGPAPASTDPAREPAEAVVPDPSDTAEPDATVLDESVDTDTAVDAAEPATAIDENQAIDLFAERMTALEQAGDGDPDAADAQLQKAFDAREEGGDDAATRTRELRAHLQDWIDALSPQHPHDVLLASVECRAGGCRVLVAEGGVDLSGQAEVPGGAAVNALQASFLALRATDWWPRLQLGEASMSMHAADPALAPGYVLWTIYVGVTGESAASAPAA